MAQLKLLKLIQIFCFRALAFFRNAIIRLKSGLASLILFPTFAWANGTISLSVMLVMRPDMNCILKTSDAPRAILHASTSVEISSALNEIFSNAMYTNPILMFQCHFNLSRNLQLCMDETCTCMSCIESLHRCLNCLTAIAHHSGGEVQQHTWTYYMLKLVHSSILGHIC